MRRSAAVSKWLEGLPPQWFSAYCMAAAFGSYFCMYAFRKPFTAGTFEDDALYGVGYKTLLVVSQVLGYTASKFVGIRWVSEWPHARRAWGILVLIGWSHLALLLFAVVPPPYNLPLLFLNGLPLGMVFGLVLSFLEGRRLTELLTAGLCASFIVASGVVKSVGQWLIQSQDISEYWMPFVAGSIFIPPLLLSVGMLSMIPPPNAGDIAARMRREPVARADRQAFFGRHAWGLSMLVGVYTLLTIFRSLRDDFAVEIWRELGAAEQPRVYAQSETLVMLGVVTINGAAFLIQDNRRAFLAALCTILAGFATIVAAIAGFHQGWLGGFAFMVTLGVGTYVPYVAFHTTLFERLIAAFRDRANLAYLMYLADAAGYLGYVVILLWRSFGSIQVSFLWLLQLSGIVTGLLSVAMVAITAIHYGKVTPRRRTESG